MEISFPLPAIILFLASMLIPADVDRIEMTIEDKEITWTRDADGTWKSEQPNPMGDVRYTITGTTARQVQVLPMGDNVKPFTKNMDDYLKLLPDSTPPEVVQAYWEKTKQVDLTDDSFGSPIMIRRDPTKNQISLSQKQGPLAESPVIISWK